jgi:hypothetical protein
MEKMWNGFKNALKFYVWCRSSTKCTECSDRIPNSNKRECPVARPQTYKSCPSCTVKYGELTPTHVLKMMDDKCYKCPTYAKCITTPMIEPLYPYPSFVRDISRFAKYLQS